MLKIFIKRLLLVIVGIFLSLVLLECGLRLAGFTISSYQQYKNSKALKNKSQYTIMCLGESTTAGQYPIQLQEILNDKYPNKFSVIDCGVIGTNIEHIYESLLDNLNKYHPNITICMMGMSELIENFKKNKNNKFEKFKIYKVYEMFSDILDNNKQKRIFVDYTTTNDIDSELHDLIEEMKSEDQKDKTQNKLLNFYSKDLIYKFLSRVYLEEKNYDLAEKYSKLGEKEHKKYFEQAHTMHNYYKLIIEKLVNSNIKVICMQYPMRDLQLIQNILKNEQYYNEIAFIDNDKVFREELNKKNYYDIFTDQYAGDFGHCTNLGNTMIAENVVETLENILDLKNE